MGRHWLRYLLVAGAVCLATLSTSCAAAQPMSSAEQLADSCAYRSGLARRVCVNLSQLEARFDELVLRYPKDWRVPLLRDGIEEVRRSFERLTDDVADNPPRKRPRRDPPVRKEIERWTRAAEREDPCRRLVGDVRPEDLARPGQLARLQALFGQSGLSDEERAWLKRQLDAMDLGRAWTRWERCNTRW